MSKKISEKEIDPTPLFPPASDRAAWLAALKKPHSRRIARELVRTAREVLTQPIPALPASLFMEFVRNGDRSHYQAPYFARRANLNALVMAEVIEYKGKYLDAIIDYLWEITAEHTWCLPAHFHLKDDPFPEPPAEVVDLFAAETGMTLSQVLNLLEPELKAVSPNLVKTVRENLSRRVVEPILRKPFPFWWLVGISNWTPWCCSECLATALCVLKDQPARLRKAVSVLQKGIDAFIRQYSADGFGVEGPSYWSKSPACCFPTWDSSGGGATARKSDRWRNISPMPALRRIIMRRSEILPRSSNRLRQTAGVRSSPFLLLSAVVSGNGPETAV